MEYLAFLKQLPPVTLVAVIGDEGKSTTAYLAYEILKGKYPPPQVVDDKVEFTPTPAVFWLNAENNLEELVKKIKREDIILVELDEKLIKEFDEAGVSAAVVVCTNILPVTHGREAAHIEEQALAFKRQTSNNVIIIGEDTFAQIKKKLSFSVKAKTIFKRADDVLRSWNSNFKGYHNRENAALALGVAEMFKIAPSIAESAITRLAPLAGRMQLVRSVRGVEIYNDALSKTPAATLAALKTLSNNKNVVLIMGGRNIGFNPKFLVPLLKEYCSGVVLLAGTGTLLVHKDILSIASMAHGHAQSLDEALEKGMDLTRSGDILLFSPAFGAVSEENRSEQFLQAVENIV